MSIVPGPIRDIRSNRWRYTGSYRASPRLFAAQLVHDRFARGGRAVGAPIDPNINRKIEDNLLTTSTMARGKGSSSKKRSYRKRRRIYRRKRIPTVAPYSKVIKLKTCLGSGINATTGNVGVQVYGANCCNDPFLSEGSAQPLGFDQWSGLYNKYVVVGYKIKVKACTQDNTNPVMLGITPSTSSTALASILHYQESKATKSTLLTMDIDKTFLSHKGSIKKWLLPRGGKLLTDDQLYAATSANPTRPLYLHVWAGAPDTSADPSNVIINVTLEQIIVFFDPVNPARS